MPVTHPVYPFSALVGQERLKQALLLNAVNPRIGGVLIRGEKGTAKSTAVRGLARLLPPITVVKGCPYSCTPEHPANLCPTCRERYTIGESLPTVVQPTRLVELPVSASEDRVVGSLDLEHAITEGQRRFEPGLLAQVNRGLLYVDEVNLLDDHLVDLLLDAAAMGVNTVEREGISVSHPSRFMLVGTMNPEEGELRPQLLDRFGLAVEITGLPDVAGRVAVLERRAAYEADPEGFVASWQRVEQKLAEQIIAARALFPQVVATRAAMTAVANLSLELQVDGHRADLTILETARAHAAWNKRKRVAAEDVVAAAKLALPHRMRRQPFSDTSPGSAQIEAVLARTTQMGFETGARDGNEKKNHHSISLRNDEITEATPGAEWDGSQTPVGVVSPTDTTSGSPHTSTNGEAEHNNATYETDSLFRPRRLEGFGDQKPRGAPGRRSMTRTTRKQGRSITSVQVPRVTDLALVATLRAAAPYQRRRWEEAYLPPSQRIPDSDPNAPGPRKKVMIHRDDLRQHVRIRRTRNAVCFVVDASWSMAAEERMQASRATVLSLLQDAYQRRDYVGLVSFQRTYATILLPLTSSVDLAQKRLSMMPVGGKTPLARGLLTGYEMLDRMRRLDAEVIPLLVVITDGQANVAMGTMPPQLEAYRVAQFIAQQNMRAIVIDTDYSQGDYEPCTITSAHASRVNIRLSNFERGLAQRLAEHLQGQYYRLETLSEHSMTQMVRTRMGG